MTQKVVEYAVNLHNSQISQDLLAQVNDIFEAVPQIVMDFTDPTVTLEKKHLVIERVFPKEIRDFLKLLCDNNDISLWKEIVAQYREQSLSPKQKATQAVLSYVTIPNEQQLEGIRAFLRKECNRDDMELILQEDASLESGFILRIGSKEYDWSQKGRLRQLEEKLAGAVKLPDSSSISAKQIISILRANVEDFELEAKNQEVGIVKFVGDGIANVDGIDHAFYGEIVNAYLIEDN